MRLNLYICCRCGKEQRTQVECDEAPLGWSLLTFCREQVEMIEGERKLQRSLLSTHACGDCCPEVLAFLEKAIRPEIDRAFDDGGVA